MGTLDNLIQQLLTVREEYGGDLKVVKLVETNKVLRKNKAEKVDKVEVGTLKNRFEPHYITLKNKPTYQRLDIESFEEEDKLILIL